MCDVSTLSWRQFTIHSNVILGYLKAAMFSWIIKSDDHHLNAKKGSLDGNHIEIVQEVKWNGRPCDDETIMRFLDGFWFIFLRNLPSGP